MLLPDETYDAHQPRTTLANFNWEVTVEKLRQQQTKLPNTEISRSTAFPKTFVVIPNVKPNPGISEFKRNDSLSDSGENSVSGTSDNGCTLTQQKPASNFFNNILSTLDDDLRRSDEFAAVAQQSGNDAATSYSQNSSISAKSRVNGSTGATSATKPHTLPDEAGELARRIACEDFLRRHRMRPDFFCQYHKAIKAATARKPAPNQTPRAPKKERQTTPKKREHRQQQQQQLETITYLGEESPKASDFPITTVENAAIGSVTGLFFDAETECIKPMKILDEANKNNGSTDIIYTLPLSKRNKTRQKATFSDAEVRDASSSNEAVHLQQRLKSLSTELVTLRNRLHVGQSHSANSGSNGTVSAAGQQQQQSSTAAHHLNVSTPNLLSSVHNNTLQKHQQQQLQISSSHSAITPTIAHNSSSSNNNSHSSNATLTPCNNNSYANNNSTSTKLHTISHTLPHNSSSSVSNTVNAAALSGTVGAIISTRNTSIPHPLPPTVQQSPSQALQQQQLHSSNTLPMRSGAVGVHAHHSHPHNYDASLIQVPIQKQHGACNGSVFSNTVAPFGIARANGAQRSTCSLHLAGGQQAGSNSYGNGMGNKQPTEIEDLIHLPGPLTEDAVMRTLQARFNNNCYFTNVGPILLSINPYRDVGNSLTLSSTRTLPLAPQLHKIVQEAVRQQTETGYPQAIILSGTSGAGKTHCSMLLLRQLFAVAGGGPETDAFKHLAAAFTVLRSLGSAKTTTNSESSRIGQFIEVQVTDGALYRTKIHCYFLDQTRVIRPLPKEKNYHIFYQMLAGLSREERVKLNLEGYSPTNLRYLQSGDVIQNEQEDATRFQAWKTCLGILGIPFLDVVRVLAAVLLLGNVQFVDGQGIEVDVRGEAELNSVASLLGVPPAALFRGLTTRTHNARGQLVKSVCDANMSNMTRDCLAKALYCRTVATIVRRANSLKRLGSTLGTLSSDSNESVHNQADVASQHTSTIGGNSGSKSMAALNNAVRHATDGFIGILDMFGFEDPSHAQLEHLCINLCAETMQHFYNTHIFKSSVESCRDEGIVCDAEVDYVDNVPCIDLISSLRTGLLSMLDAECSIRGTAESYVAKIKVQHRSSTRLETKHTTEPHDPRLFIIRHFAGRVEYDTTDFLDTNRDVVRDDLVAVFYKHTCNFGFATHLFGSELKALYALQNVPRGLSFRISPTSHTDLLNGDEPVSTLTQDFHTRLDNLLRTLVHARPHFVRCIRSNGTESIGCFERSTVVRQIRSLQVLETVNLMASGFPHRMRFKQFNARYVAMLAPYRLHRRTEDKSMEDCNLILQYAMENPPVLDGSVTLSWAPGKRHVFLSEGMRQHLEHLRSDIRAKSATMIQATWRGWHWRKKMGKVKRPRSVGGGVGMLPAMPTSISNVTKMTKLLHNGGAGSLPRLSAKTANLIGTVARPRPQPIAGTPPPDPNEKCDTKIIQQTCSLFGLDLERPPPVPSSRAYTITGNSKLGYPQSRIMKMNFPDDANIANPTNNGITQATEAQQLKKGETVNVVGASTCRGHLIVDHKNQSFHVPFQYMELRSCNISGSGANTSANNPQTHATNGNSSGGDGHCNNKNNKNSSNGNVASIKNNAANNNTAVATTVNI